MEGIGEKKKSVFSFIRENNSILYILIGFLVLLIILLGITFSYAFWTAIEVQNDQNEVTAGCLSFTYNDKDVSGNATSITLNNAYPISDARGIASTPYSFSLTNTCNLKANMDIYFHTLSTSTLSSGYIKLKLSSEGSSFILGPKLVSTLNAKVLDSNTSSNISTVIGGFNETYLLSNVTLEPVATISYDLNLWIDEAAPNEIMGQTYAGAISIMATPTK